MGNVHLVFDAGAQISPYILGALALVGLVLTIILTHRDVVRLRPLVRVAVMALTILGVLTAIGILLNPRFVKKWPDPQKPKLTLVVDGSRSMLLNDAYNRADSDWLRAHQGQPPGTEPVTLPRLDVERLLLGVAPGDWLAEAKQKFEISAWRFSNKTEGLSLDDPQKSLQVDTDGYSTAEGPALEDATRGAGGLRPRAVVLIGDGAWNTARDPADVARVLGRLGVPIYAVGVGDPEPPRDVAVVALRGPRDCLLGDMLYLTAEITATGASTMRLNVELLDEGRVVAERSVSTLPGGRPQKVEMSTVPLTAGRRTFTARVRPLEDEQNTDNNEASTTLDVTDQKMRILLVDAEPRWEFRFLRSVFERDPGVTLTVCLLRPGVGPISGPGYLSELPTDQKGFSEYDIVFLGDVGRSDQVTDDFLKNLSEMVTIRGGALVLVAGRRQHYRELVNTEVEKILPVEIRPVVSSFLGGDGAHPELTQDGAGHLITRIGNDAEETERIWNELAPPQWTADVGALAPGAVALLVNPNRLVGLGKQPILAVQSVGMGKVLFSGMEETWRWRKSIGDKYHYRFWAQAIRWLVRRHFAEGDDLARLSLSRAECNINEKVEIEAFVTAPDGFPLANAEVAVRIASEGSQPRRLALTAAPGGWGVYRGTFVPQKDGHYTFAPIVSKYGKEPLRSSATLDVVRPDLEKSFLAQDRNSLKAVAEASGGRYLSVSETGTLDSLLGAKAERRMLTAEYAPFRHWASYGLLAAALSAAWLLRKWMGLP